MSQRPLVEQSIAFEHGSVPTRRWPVRSYAVPDGTDRMPEPGSIVMTVPGCYWRTGTVTHASNGVSLVRLEPVETHSLDVHGPLSELPFGRLF